MRAEDLGEFLINQVVCWVQCDGVSEGASFCQNLGYLDPSVGREVTEPYWQELQKRLASDATNDEIITWMKVSLPSPPPPLPSPSPPSSY